MHRKALIVVFGVALVAAPSASRETARAGDGDSVARVDTSSWIVQELAKVAKDYKKVGRVDDEARLAPALCRPPRHGEPRLSDSHGERKVYFLYAKDRDAYLAGTAVQGQWVVKESFADASCRGAIFPGEARGLFILLRIGPTHCGGTDDGWVYATATPEGELTNAGEIESCMKCHALAKHERLFGLDGKKLGATETKKEEKP